MSRCNTESSRCVSCDQQDAGQTEGEPTAGAHPLTQIRALDCVCECTNISSSSGCCIYDTEVSWSESFSVIQHNLDSPDNVTVTVLICAFNRP